MSYQFRPAVREDLKLMIGLGGPSGSGKTYSALRLARGLAGGKPIFFVDTEARRALHYAGEFEFLHAELAAPFEPSRYQGVIEAAVKAGAGVVIVDSMSHEHEGPGGILEWHERELQRMAGDDYAKRDKMKFTAWIKPKQAHNRLVNTILQLPVHFIFCFRAKDKLVMVRNAQGKQEPVSIGWQPICSDRFEYEMSMMLMLPPGAGGVPDIAAKATKLQEQHRGIVRPGEQLSEAMGERLATWARGTAVNASKAEPPPSNPTPPSGEPSSAPIGRFPIHRGKTTERVETIEQWRERMINAAENIPSLDNVERFRDLNGAVMADLGADFPKEVRDVAEAFERRLQG